MYKKFQFIQFNTRVDNIEYRKDTTSPDTVPTRWLPKEPLAVTLGAHAYIQKLVSNLPRDHTTSLYTKQSEAALYIFMALEVGFVWVVEAACDKQVCQQTQRSDARHGSQIGVRVIAYATYDIL